MHTRDEVVEALRAAVLVLPADMSYAARAVAVEGEAAEVHACVYYHEADDEARIPMCLVGQALAQMDLLDDLDPMANDEKFDDTNLAESFTEQARMLLRGVQDEQDNNTEKEWRRILVEYDLLAEDQL